MDNLARGWTIMMEHLHSHGHGPGLAIWIAIMVAVWLPIWAGLRKKKDEDADDGRLTPKRRAPLPRPDRGFRE